MASILHGFKMAASSHTSGHVSIKELSQQVPENTPLYFSLTRTQSPATFLRQMTGTGIGITMTRRDYAREASQKPLLRLRLDSTSQSTWLHKEGWGCKVRPLPARKKKYGEDLSWPQLYLLRILMSPMSNRYMSTTASETCAVSNLKCKTNHYLHIFIFPIIHSRTLPHNQKPSLKAWRGLPLIPSLYKQWSILLIWLSLSFLLSSPNAHFLVSLSWPS